MQYCRFVLVMIVCNCFNFLQAQTQCEILFEVGDNIVSKKEAFDVLGISSKNGSDITVAQFNDMLSFYLTIYDFKSRGADTTQVFRRKLEAQTFNILGSIYGAENHQNIMNKCSIARSSFAIVKDLFVPFDPMLLRSIQKMKEQDSASFDEVAKYATANEGTYLGTRIISPSESVWALSRAACDLLERNHDHDFVGPIKDLKGYHYLQLLREQDNFGRYKTQMIYTSGIEGSGEVKIKAAYKMLNSGIDFETVASKYSEARTDKDDNSITYFTPSINTNKIIQKQLEKLTRNGAISKPFFAAGGWYIIKRLSKENFPSNESLKERALIATRRPSFFVEELKEKYKAQEYPYNFFTGKDELLFLVALEPYYTKDLKAYARKYGYDYTTETYDRFFNFLLVERYKRELDKERYQKLIDDFYFFQIRNPMLNYIQGAGREQEMKDLRRLVKKYKPIIPNKKYVQGNPIFEN